MKSLPRQQILLEFTKIHGVGPSTARELYDQHGCRSIKDVENVSHLLPSMGEKSTARELDLKFDGLLSELYGKQL